MGLIFYKNIPKHGSALPKKKKKKKNGENCAKMGLYFEKNP